MIIKSSLFKFLFIFFLIYLASSANTFAEDNDILLAYQNTNLSFTLLDEYINPESCDIRKSLKKFFGCVDALDSLLRSSAENDLKLVPINAHLILAQSKIIEFNTVQLIRLNSQLQRQQLLNIPFQLSLLAEKRSLDSLWQKSQFTIDKIEFESVYSEIKNRVPLSHAKWAVASAFESYFANTIDPHTRLVPQKFLDDSKQSQKQYYSIGIVIENHALGAEVIDLISGGPAEKSGLIKKNDIITYINDKPIHSFKDIQAVINEIRGEKGTFVSLKLLRENRVIDVQVVRDQIVNNNLESQLLNHHLYIKIDSFYPTDLCEAFQKKLKENQSAKTIILDLRDNRGGLVRNALCLVVALRPDGLTTIDYLNKDSFKKIKTVHGGQKNKKPFNFLKNTINWALDLTYRKTKKFPVIILTNAQSASASELVAAAIREYRLGFIVGDTTYGKGNFQNTYKEPHLPKEWKAFTGLSVKQTGGLYAMPSGFSPQLVGVVPDFKAYKNKTPSRKEILAQREKDLYRFPLKGTPVQTQSTHPELNKVKLCVQRSQSVDHFYKENDDYQLSVALAVADCAL